MFTTPAFLNRILRKPPHRATAAAMPEWAARQRADLVAAGAAPKKLARFDRLFGGTPPSMTDAQLQALVNAIDRLDPNVRAVLNAYYVEKRTFEEISRSMRVSTETCCGWIRSGKLEVLRYMSHDRKPEKANSLSMVRKDETLMDVRPFDAVA